MQISRIKLHSPNKCLLQQHVYWNMNLTSYMQLTLAPQLDCCLIGKKVDSCKIS